MKTIETRSLQTNEEIVNKFAFLYGRLVNNRYYGTVVLVDDDGNIIEKSGVGTFYGDNKRQVRKQLRRRVEQITASEINDRESIEFVETSKRDAQRFKQREKREKRWHRFKTVLLDL